MITPKIKAGCGVLMVFGLGFVIGAFALILLVIWVRPLSEGWKSGRSKQYIARHFQNQLDLTDEQMTRFRPLVDEALDRRWELRRDYLLSDRKLMEEDYFPRLKEFLDPEQQTKAAKMLERWRESQRLWLNVEETRESGGEPPPP